MCPQEETVSSSGTFWKPEVKKQNINVMCKHEGESFSIPYPSRKNWDKVVRALSSAIPIILNCFLFITFSPFQRYPKFAASTAPVTGCRWEEEHWFSLGSSSVKGCVWRWTSGSLLKESETGEVWTDTFWGALGSLYSTVLTRLALGDYWFFSWILLLSPRYTELWRHFSRTMFLHDAIVRFYTTGLLLATQR